MNDDTVMTLVAFGGWTSLLCLALCVAGWVGDKARDRYNRQRDAYADELNAALQADREARGRHLTADEVISRSRAA
jgi:hypothetical protein